MISCQPTDYWAAAKRDRIMCTEKGEAATVFSQDLHYLVLKWIQALQDSNSLHIWMVSTQLVLGANT